jgi:hypothetical protein
MGGGSNVSPALSSRVHQQHLSQFSQESINNYLGFHATVTSGAALRNSILQAFKAGGQNGVGCLVALNPSIGEGHVVVAFDVVDTGGGNFDILVYNPNHEFIASEDTNTTLRAGQAAGSVIHVMSNGNWNFPDFGWNAGILGITVTPWNALPLMPTFPMPEVLAAIGTAGALVGVLMLFVVGDAEITQVSDAQGHKLLANGQLNTDPATMLTGVRPMPAFGGLRKKSIPAFVSNRQDALTHTITGKTGGSYTVTSMAHGLVATVSGVPASGAADTVAIDQGKVNFTGATDKPVTITLVGMGKTSKLPRTAVLKTSAALNLSFDPVAETFDYVHQGASGNYTLELSSLDANGQAVKLAMPSAPVAKGDTLKFSPEWTRLAAGTGKITLRNAAGIITDHPLK